MDRGMPRGLYHGKPYSRRNTCRVVALHSACPPLTMSGPEVPSVLGSAFTPAPRADGASTWAAPEYADPTPGDLRPSGPSAAKRPRLEGDSQGGGAAGAPLVLETEVEVLDGGLVNTYEVQHPLASRDTLCGEGAVALRCMQQVRGPVCSSHARGYVRRRRTSSSPTLWLSSGRARDVLLNSKLRHVRPRARTFNTS